MITPESFVEQIRVNVDNTKLSDESFREFIRNTLTIVERKSYLCSYCGKNLGTDRHVKCPVCES